MKKEEIFVESIARKVNEVRVTKGYSYRKLAAMSGVAYQNICDFVHGSNIGIESLGKICDALGVEVDVKEKGEEPPSPQIKVKP